MSHRFEDEPGRRLPTEGVRILGAEEAEAALSARRSDDDLHVADDTLPGLDDAGTDDRGPNDWGPDDRGRGDRGRGDRGRDDARPVPGTPLPGTQGAESYGDETREIVVFDADAETDADTDDTAVSRPLRYPDEGPTWSASASEEQVLDSVDSDLEAWGAATPAAAPGTVEGSDRVDAELPGAGVSTGQTAVDDDAEFERELAERRRQTPRGRAPRTLVTGSASERLGVPNGPTSSPSHEEPSDEGPSHGRPSEKGGANEFVPPGATRGRDLRTALITAGIVAVVALICFTQGTFWTVILTAIIVALGTLEFCTGLQARGFRPATALALTAAFFLPIAAREFGSDAYPVFFGLVVIFSMLWFLWQVTPGRPLLGVATTVLAFAYVGGLGGYAGLLLGSSDGIGLILGLALCVITYDVVGYFVGSQFGRNPIAPNISPNKSFEGTLAGMAAAVLMGWLFVGGALVGGIHPWSPGDGAVLGLFVAAGAFLGDLCESMLKRDLGIKDFGSLLPGHGGVLDRFDGILFCLPIAYYLSVHLNIL